MTEKNLNDEKQCFSRRPVRPGRKAASGKRLRAGIVLLCLLLCFAACDPDDGGNVDDSREGSGGDAAAEKITLVLDYVPNTNHTGFYVARELGYFEEEGLDVEIIEPADNTVTTLIATGRGDFGVSYQEDVTYALTAAQPLPVKAIAAIIQHNTSGFASWTEKDIKRPRDFEGKTYAGWGAPSEEAVIDAVMTADGGDFSRLNIVVSDGSGYTALKDRVDIIWLFWAWDGIMAKRAGVPLDYLELREFDERLDYYTPVIIASEEKLENDPEQTKKFLRATRRGYEYCIARPEEAARILHEQTGIYDLDMLIESQIYLADKYIDDAKSWGLMKDSVWENYTDFMAENGLIGQRIEASACYTNEFLQE